MTWEEMEEGSDYYQNTTQNFQRIPKKKKFKVTTDSILLLIIYKPCISISSR